MAEQKTTIPNIKFGMFYPDIIRNINIYKDTNLPELNNSNPLDLANQFLSIAACIGHLSNCLIDTVANESLIDTAKNPDVVRRHLSHIGYDMSAATPSKATVVFELTTDFTAGLPKTILPVESTFAGTNADDNSITFHSLSEVVLNNASDAPTQVFIYEEDNGTPWQDVTTNALSTVTPGNDVQPFTSVHQAGDCLYIGHEDVMFDNINLFFTTENQNVQGVWEFYSGDFYKTRPDTVIQIGSFLRMNVNSYLGEVNRQKTKIRVLNKSNGFYEDVYSYWDGENNIVDTNTLLNQSTVNTDVTNYTIGSDWEELTSEQTMFFGVDDHTLDYELPQSTTQNWIKTTVNGQEAYWIRFRLTEKITGTLPVMTYLEFGADEPRYMIVDVEQGSIQYDSGYSGNGIPNQKFLTTKEGFINDGTETFIVGATTWTKVNDFISSSATDTHYVIEFDENNIATFIVGDGKNGAIPTVGSGNINIKYKYGAEEDGNVSAKSIIGSTSGASFIKGIFNPRSAYGWAASDYSSDEAIEQAKKLASQNLKIINVALNPSDVEILAKSFRGSDGGSRFSRVFAYSDLEYPVQGYKTMKLIVVLKGGGTATNDELAEIEEYFNGNKTSSPTKPSRLVAGQKLFAANYSKKTINIKAVVTKKGNVDVDDIKNKLTEVFNPEAKNVDGEYVWKFNDTISLSRIKHYIHEANQNITKVDIQIPENDVGLSVDELPTIGSVSIEFN